MKTKEITCKNCGVKCNKSLKEINRQIKKGRNSFYCSLSCSSTFNKTTSKKIKRKCIGCGKEFESTSHKKYKKCCCGLCARNFPKQWTIKMRNKASLENKKRWDAGVYGNRICNNGKYHLVCSFCKSNFVSETLRKTCGNVCFKKRLSQSSKENPNCGGETNYKKYKYDGVWMDSSWEVELAKWMDVQGIKWERSRKKHMFWWTDIDGNRRRYYPDFYLPLSNIYVDTKNPYLIKCDDYKIKSVIGENEIRMVFGDIEKVKKELRNIKD